VAHCSSVEREVNPTNGIILKNEGGIMKFSDRGRQIECVARRLALGE